MRVLSVDYGQTPLQVLAIGSDGKSVTVDVTQLIVVHCERCGWAHVQGPCSSITVVTGGA